MHKCIFCLAEFQESDKEHIIHAFLGAPWKQANLICNDCQKTFGDGIDVALAERVQPCRLLLGIEGDHGGTGQNLKNLPATSGEVIELGPHGKPSLSRPYVKITETDDKYKVSLKVRREQDVAWALHEVKKEIPDIKVDVEQLKKSGVPTSEPIEGNVNFEIALGGAEFFRAVLKMCVNLFAAHDAKGRDAFYGTEFDSVREFVLHGTGGMSDFARWIVSEVPLELPSKGPADQAIFLTTRGRSVEGVVRFFGNLAFAVRLVNEFEGTPIRCAYIVDPYREADPAQLKLSGEELVDLDTHIPLFSEQSPGNNATVQQAWNASLNRFMAHYTERENELVVWKVVDDVLGEGADINQRKDLAVKARQIIRKRLDEYERTGQSRGLISEVKVDVRTPRPS